MVAIASGIDDRVCPNDIVILPLMVFAVKLIGPESNVKNPPTVLALPEGIFTEISMSAISILTYQIAADCNISVHYSFDDILTILCIRNLNFVPLV
jgi:hypothetical protein